MSYLPYSPEDSTRKLEYCEDLNDKFDREKEPKLQEEIWKIKKNYIGFTELDKTVKRLTEIDAYIQWYEEKNI